MRELPMSEEDREYCLVRKRQELARAAICEDKAVAKAHLDMADLYQRRAEEGARLKDSESGAYARPR